MTELRRELRREIAPGLAGTRPGFCASRFAIPVYYGLTRVAFRPRHP